MSRSSLRARIVELERRRKTSLPAPVVRVHDGRPLSPLPAYGLVFDIVFIPPAPVRKITED